MELSGSLKRFPVSKVLQFLNMDAATGLLNLRAGKQRITIVMEDGNILDVEDAERSKEQRIRTVMIDSGRLAGPEFDALLEERRQRLVPIGTILVDRGYLNAETHLRMSRLVYLTILFEAMAWKDGTYEFERRDDVLPTELADAISVASLMLNAARQEDEWPTIRRYVPNANAVFGRGSTSDANVWDRMMEELGPDEQRIARCIDGISTVKMIADTTFSTEFETSSIIAELVKRGMLARMYDQEAAYAEARPRGFFSFKLGPLALNSMKIAVALIALLFAWKNYAAPIVYGGDDTMTVLANAGQDADTVNRLRLLRLQHAFYVYLREQGSPPSSLALLARMEYCDESDLHIIGGGYYVLKILGLQEETARIQAVDRNGAPIPALSVEIAVR